jgi:hypothetical protein
MKFKNMFQFSLKLLNFTGHFVARSALLCSSNDRTYDCLIPFAYCVKVNRRVVPISHIFKNYFIISSLIMVFVETSVI